MERSSRPAGLFASSVRTALTRSTIVGSACVVEGAKPNSAKAPRNNDPARRPTERKRERRMPIVSLSLISYAYFNNAVKPILERRALGPLGRQPGEYVLGQSLRVNRWNIDGLCPIFLVHQAQSAQFNRRR